MRKIIILGCLGFDFSTINNEVLKNNTEIVTNNIEAKNIINSQFEPEPIIFNNTYRDNFEITQVDIPRNKFLEKPRYNYRRR